MSMTPASTQYFDQVAGQWDQLRSGYFTEAVRKAAIAEGLSAPGHGGGRCRRRAPALCPPGWRRWCARCMSSMARLPCWRWRAQNLKDFENMVFQQAEGLSLPLPDASLDAVFANMYLHHCPDPWPPSRRWCACSAPAGGW